MEKFTRLTGVAAPLPIVNVDTDMIIPKDYLKTIERTGLSVGLFAEMRFNEDGSDAPEGLYYVGCDAQCEQHESWQRAFLMPTGSGSYPYPGWDVDLTADGRPRDTSPSITS